MQTSRWIPVTIVGMVFWGISVAWADDWPQWRGPHRDGRSAEKGLLKRWPADGPPLVWTATGLGEGYSSVAVAGGTIYTNGLVGQAGVLFAFDLQGKLKWKKEYGPDWTGQHRGTRGTPTVDDGLVYVMSGVGDLVCFDAADGSRKWSARPMQEAGASPPPWGIAESPLVVGRHVIVTPGGRQAGLIAYDKKTGDLVWRSRGSDEKSAYCSPILVPLRTRKLIVTMLAKSIVGVDAATGTELWRHRHETSYDVHAVSPVFEDGLLYATSGYGSGGVALKLAPDGRRVAPQWTDRTLDVHIGGVVLVDGFIYGTKHQPGQWVCLDFNTGQVKYTDRGLGKGAVIYADGMLYGYGENGMVGLARASPQGFHLVSQFRVREGTGQHWAHPAIADGRLYIRHGDALMAYDLRSRSGPGASE